MSGISPIGPRDTGYTGGSEAPRSFDSAHSEELLNRRSQARPGSRRPAGQAEAAASQGMRPDMDPAGARALADNEASQENQDSQGSSAAGPTNEVGAPQQSSVMHYMMQASHDRVQRLRAEAEASLRAQEGEAAQAEAEQPDTAQTGDVQASDVTDEVGEAATTAGSVDASAGTEIADLAGASVIGAVNSVVAGAIAAPAPRIGYRRSWRALSKRELWSCKGWSVCEVRLARHRTRRGWRWTHRRTYRRPVMDTGNCYEPRPSRRAVPRRTRPHRKPKQQPRSRR